MTETGNPSRQGLRGLPQLDHFGPLRHGNNLEGVELPITTMATSGAQMDGYLNYMLERGLSPLTLQHRLTFARARWDEWRTWNIDGTTIATWLARFTGWTKVTYYNHLRSLFTWLVHAGEVPSDPMLLIRRPPTPRARPKPLTEDELRLVLETASPDVRDWVMLGYLAGLRRFEIAKLRGEDIDERSVFVVGKGGQAWTVPTHPLLWELAQHYPRSGYWFPSPHRHSRPGQSVTPGHVGSKVAQHFHSLGITGATHRARHTYGTELLRGGANLRVVQELMRHSSLATTALYLGVDEDEKSAAIHRLAA